MRRLLILVAALALLTTACKVELNAEFTINADKSGSVKVEFGVDDELLAMAGSDDPQDLFSEMDIDLGDVPGATTTTERRGEFTFYIVEVPVDDITQAEGLGTQAGLEGLGEEFQITFTEDRVTIDGAMSLGDAMSGAGAEDLGGITPEMLAQFVEINLRVNMPGSIVESNADEVNGSTLTWNVDFTAEELDIHAVSDPTGSSGGFPLWAWLLIGAGGLLVLALLFTMIGRSRRAPAAPGATAPPAGDAPPPPPPSE